MKVETHVAPTALLAVGGFRLRTSEQPQTSLKYRRSVLDVLFQRRPSLPSLNGILETSVHVEDMERSIRFYQGVMQFEKLLSDEPFCALKAAQPQVLLLFKKGASTQPKVFEGGTIPPHDGSGQTHLAFAILAQELEPWERGGQSIYLRDSDGHLLELVTPGCWAIYLGAIHATVRHHDG